MKKLFVACMLILSLLLPCLVGCGSAPQGTVPDGGTGGAGATTETSSVADEALSSAAAAVFTLDVNPGVRIYVKADNTVLSVEATNEDGKEVVAELDISGADYEAIVEAIIDRLEEKGYLAGENNSILISIEKQELEISEKVNDRINKAFEKLGKTASVIEQELDRLDEALASSIEEIARRYGISEGKANLIEKIRGEFPELSEEELAGLKVNDLGMILEETTDAVKEQFKKIGKAVEDAYVGREAALATALESLEITADDITMPRVRATRGEGRMLYEVEFVYDGMKYEITVDAGSGAILSTESEEYVAYDPAEIIDRFCKEHEIDIDSLKDLWENPFWDRIDPNPGGEEHGAEEKPLTRSEILKGILDKLGISGKALKKTDAELHVTESGTVYSVTVVTEAGDVYKLTVEAYTGTVIRAELNGAVTEIGTDTGTEAELTGDTVA